MKNKITKEDIELTKKKFELFDEKLEEEKSNALGYVKNDPSLFAYMFFTDVMGNRFKTFSYQDIILNDKSKRKAICIARQTGKSTLSVIAAFHQAYFNDSYTVVVVSATKPQALELIRKLKTILRTGRFTTWKEIMPKGKESGSEIIIKNQNGKTESRIISVPATDSARGYTANMVIVDEAAFIENGDYIFNQVIEPMTQYTKGQIFLLSTPNGKIGFFWKCFNSEAWSTYQFGWEVCPNNTKEEMVEKRKMMTSMEFSAEYEAKFLTSQSAYFNYKDIERAVDSNSGLGSPTSNVFYSIGVDFGKIKDNSVIMIGYIENPGAEANEQVVKVIRRIVKPLGTNYASVIGEVKDLARMFPGRLVLDATGVGEGPSDILIKEGLSVEPIKFSIQSKMDIYSNLNILFEQSRIKIPNELELINQLEQLEYEYTESKNQKIHHPEGGHDDETDALALMAWGLTKTKGQPSVRIIDNPIFSGLIEEKQNKKWTTVCVKCEEYFDSYEGKRHFEPNKICPKCFI